MNPATLKERMERDWVTYRDSRNLVQHWIDYFYYLTHRDKGHLRLAAAFNRKQLKGVGGAGGGEDKNKEQEGGAG